MCITSHLPFEDGHNPTSSIHVHTVAGLQTHCGVSCAHNSGNAQLTRYDGCMGKGFAHISDDSRRPRKKRRPTDVGAGSHQYLARFQEAALIRVI